MRLRRLFLTLAVIFILTTSASASSWSMEMTDTIDTSFGSVYKTQYSFDTVAGKLREKRYSYPDGASFFTQRLYVSQAVEDELVLHTFELPGEKLEVKYYSVYYGEWKTSVLTQTCQYTFGMFYLRLDDSSDMIICAPQAYIPHDNDTLEALTEQTGNVRFEKTEQGWTVSVLAPKVEIPCYVDWFALTSSQILIDWDKEDAYDTWAGYRLTGDNRWCYNGYYYISPDNYQPTGSNYYFRLPAAYIACKMNSTAEEYDAAKYMSIAMLDVMLDLQNEDGYFPTKSASLWLLQDYGIGAGFYDTRFNTEIARGLWSAGMKHDIQRFKDAALRYVDFFLVYAEKWNQTVTTSGGEEGWMVYDYWSPNGAKRNHTSLNHQLAEICLLEEVYRDTGDSRLLEVEEKMFKGIQATEKSWYMADGNLEYGWYNGVMMGTDYPYLTYNDLFILDELYYDRLGYHVQVLARLMKSKKQWMDANEVTGYME